MKKILRLGLNATGRRAANEEGWAIMSSMIAIFIGLIMMAGIFGLVQIALQGSNVQAAQNHISMIRTNAQQLFSGQPDYSGLTTSLATSAGMIPSEMVSGSSVVNAWSGSVTVATGTPSSQFDITYSGLPEEACIKLAPFGYGSWDSVTVGGSSISQSGGTAVSDAVSACSGSSNTLVFTSN